MKIAKELGLKIGIACTTSIKRCTANDSLIQPTDIIGFHGGGNFYDIFPREQDFRNEIIQKYPQFKIVLMPQSVFYRKRKVIRAHKAIFDEHKNLHFTLRQQDSYDFARKNFPNQFSYDVPDIAFMIENLESKVVEPKYDILLLTRTHNAFTLDWNEVKDYIRTKTNYTYTSTDWYFHEYPFYDYSSTDLQNRAYGVLNISINLLSLGRIVVTDRLHGTILAMLMGKPHVYFDATFGKLIFARQFAFRNKTECNDAYMRSRIARNQMDAVKKAIEMLDNNLFADY